MPIHATQSDICAHYFRYYSRYFSPGKLMTKAPSEAWLKAVQIQCVDRATIFIVFLN